MAHGVPSFTPRQLLDAGRRAEAEGKLDLAHQFYGHLNDLYGHTSEATEGRNGLIRTGAGVPPPQVWQMNGTASSGPALNGKAPMRRGREKRTGHAVQSQDYENYRVGRGLAALLSAAGWLAILAASLAMAVMAAGEFMQMPALQPLNFGFGMLPLAVGVLAAGGAALLVGQAARALFDQASATRELAALGRAKAESDQS
jgi:hypothetical protein